MHFNFSMSLTLNDKKLITIFGVEAYFLKSYIYYILLYIPLSMAIILMMEYGILIFTNLGLDIYS